MGKKSREKRERSGPAASAKQRTPTPGLVPFSPNSYARSLDDDRVVITFCDDSKEEIHSEGCIHVSEVMPLMDKMMSVVIHRVADLAQLAGPTSPPLRKTAHSAAFLEVVQTSATDCILVVRTRTDEMRIALAEELTQKLREKLASLSGAGGQRAQ